jgi:hypothetical protein
MATTADSVEYCMLMFTIHKLIFTIINTFITIIFFIWTYGIQLWGAASTSDIEILERYQSKALRLITDAPWYVPNVIIRHGLQVPSVKEESCRLSAQYYAGLCTHPNLLATQLSRPSAFRRLRRHLPSDLRHRFTV